MPLSSKLLSMMEQDYLFNEEYAKKCLTNNKHNHVTTTYYLLQQKFERLGLSISDDNPAKASTD